MIFLCAIPRSFIGRSANGSILVKDTVSVGSNVHFLKVNEVAFQVF